MTLLCDAAEEELQQEGARAKLQLFGSLEQSHRGNMVAGSMTEARFGLHEDYFKGLFPYVEWPKPPPVPESGGMDGGTDERTEFLKDYARWVAGEAIEAGFVHTRDK